LRLLEKNSIELLTQEELDGSSIVPDEIENEHKDEESLSRLKSKLERSLALITEELDKEKESSKEDVRIEAYSGQLADSVKSYLRDIGKIPLLNKKTETIIARQIAESKQESIDAISRFPYLHREFVGIGEKLEKNSIHLKDIIQFSEFDEANIPMVEEEKKTLLQVIATIKELIENEEKNLP